MWAEVDPSACIGCGLCTDLAEGIFQINDSGVAEAIAEASDDQKDAVQEAIDSCPAHAISWS